MKGVTEEEIRSFMNVLIPIQLRLMNKYGRNCIDRWREERLSRDSGNYFDT